MCQSFVHFSLLFKQFIDIANILFTHFNKGDSKHHVIGETLNQTMLFMSTHDGHASLVCGKFHPRRWRGRFLEDKGSSLEQLALLPLAPVPSVSRKENIFPPPPPPPSPVTGHRIVRSQLEMWAHLFHPTFAEQWRSCRFNVLPQLSVLDHIKHATCLAKFIQFMC